MHPDVICVPPGSSGKVIIVGAHFDQVSEGVKAQNGKLVLGGVKDMRILDHGIRATSAILSLDDH